MKDGDLLEMLDREKREQQHQFLMSWKIAVKMISPHLFTVTSASIEAATDRNDLRPDVEAIEHYIQSTFNDHHYFLFMVISFFSFTTIEEIFSRAGIEFPRVIDLQLLDETERMIVYALIEASDVDGW